MAAPEQINGAITLGGTAQVGIAVDRFVDALTVGSLCDKPVTNMTAVQAVPTPLGVTKPSNFRHESVIARSYAWPCLNQEKFPC